MMLGLGLSIVSPARSLVFDPASVANMLVRYKAGDATLSGGNVQTLPNSGTMGHGTGALENDLIWFLARPLYVASDAAFGGQPVVHHNAANTALISNGTYTTSMSQPSTWYCVSSLTDSADTAFARFRVSRGMNDTNAAGLLIQPSTDTLRVTTNGANIITQAGVSSLYGRRITCVVYNGATTDIYADDMTTPIKSGNAGGSAATSFGVGYSGGTNCDLKWAEQIGYLGAHDATTRAAVKSYFTAVYG